MKKTIILIAPAMLLASPAAAADRPTASVNNVDVSVARPVAIGRHEQSQNHPNWRRINHKINKRAKNAVANGADPQLVRQKVQAYKKKLHRRWKASQ